MKNTHSFVMDLDSDEQALSVLIHLAGESARVKKKALMLQHFMKIQTSILGSFDKKVSVSPHERQES
jgi:hypothetical protein